MEELSTTVAQNAEYAGRIVAELSAKLQCGQHQEITLALNLQLSQVLKRETDSLLPCNIRLSLAFHKSGVDRLDDFHQAIYGKLIKRDWENCCSLRFRFP